MERPPWNSSTSTRPQPGSAATREKPAPSSSRNRVVPRPAVKNKQGELPRGTEAVPTQDSPDSVRGRSQRSRLIRGNVPELSRHALRRQLEAPALKNISRSRSPTPRAPRQPQVGNHKPQTSHSTSATVPGASGPLRKPSRRAKLPERPAWTWTGPNKELWDGVRQAMKVDDDEIDAAEVEPVHIAEVPQRAFRTLGDRVVESEPLQKRRWQDERRISRGFMGKRLEERKKEMEDDIGGATEGEIARER